MYAQGTFDIKLTPQNDAGASAGRLLINKTYSGDLVGIGTGQMISKRIEGGAAAYFAIEEVSGTLNGTEGSFTLLHRGFMDADSRMLEITIMPGSGGGGLAGISGSLAIEQVEGGHSWKLDYEL